MHIWIMLQSFFFFSSRRRHTRLTCDWSSDVCSSDLVPFLLVHSEHALDPSLARKFFATVRSPKSELWLESQGQIDFYDDPRLINAARSEERRVGKEWRARWSSYSSKT